MSSAKHSPDLGMPKKSMKLPALPLDQYDRGARLTPALVTLLPVMIPLVSVYGSKNPVLTGVLGLLISCGALVTLANVAGGRGKATEEKLVKKWGGMPTTIALRHSDSFLDTVTTTRYHSLIADKLGMPLPTADAERADPAAADNSYMGATRRLRELTRSDRGLLFKANINYGFHRNMLGLRPIGIATALIGLAYGLILSGSLTFRPLAFDLITLAAPGLAGGISTAVSLMLLITWLLYVSEATTRRAGFVYAERLFELLPKLAGPSKKRTGSDSKVDG